jgi:hypothetical protein
MSDKEKKPNWDKLNPEITFSGRAITLPGDPAKMPVPAAIAALQRREADDNQVYNAMEAFPDYPHDVAVAVVKAMNKLYGWVSPQTDIKNHPLFGQVKEPPTFLAIQTGPKNGDVIQCPIGQFLLPGLDRPIKGEFHPWHFGDGKRRLAYILHGEIKKKDRHVLMELVEETKRFLREESIYRGKPIRLRVNEEGEPNMHMPPEFLDVSEITEESVLFDGDIEAQIDTNLLVPIKETALCRKYGIPLKRGILLEGPYGTGKSLTARLTARCAELNGWTFILLDKVQGLRTALEFANRYAPAVVFAEDVDRIAENRTEEINDLVNIIDGVVSKGTEVMTVLTTNFVEKLNPVILRPGRLDAVISVRAPSAHTVQRLIRHYARDLLASDASVVAAGKELDGQIPAAIRECVERAKLGMIGRQDSHLSDKDFVVAAMTMKNHLALLNREIRQPSDAETLATSLKNVIGNGTSNLYKKIDEIHVATTT